MVVVGVAGSNVSTALPARFLGFAAFGLGVALSLGVAFAFGAAFALAFLALAGVLLDVAPSLVALAAYLPAAALALVVASTLR